MYWILHLHSYSVYSEVFQAAKIKFVKMTEQDLIRLNIKKKKHKVER